MPFCILEKSLPLLILLASLPTMSQIWLSWFLLDPGAWPAGQSPILKEAEEWWVCAGGGCSQSQGGVTVASTLCQHCPWWATLLINLLVSVSPQEKLLPFLEDQCGLTHLKFYIYLFIFGMWDLSSSTRDQTCAPCIGSAVLTTGPPGRSLNPF